jgi:fatty acid-binding protein DegV
MIAKEFNNVHVFEQQMVALPAKWTILDLINEKVTIEKIEKYLQNVYTKRIGFIVVPDVKYLVKGGRVSNFKGMLIKLFNLKLVVTLYNDGLKFFDKTSSIEGIVKMIPKCFSDKTKIKFDVAKLKRFSLFYSKNNEPKYMVNEIVKQIRKAYPSIEIVDEELPAIIAAHTGSNYVVVLCEFK